MSHQLKPTAHEQSTQYVKNDDAQPAHNAQTISHEKTVTNEHKQTQKRRDICMTNYMNSEQRYIAKYEK